MEADAPPLLERVHRSPPHWAGDVIQAWDEIEFNRLRPFVERAYWTDQGSVNVFRVVGTQHFDYRGKTWLRFLETGKRMSFNLEAHGHNPGYYLETVRKTPMMYYMTLDGLSYFVGSDGNHRTCIARFDFHYQGLTTLHGVTIYDYRVDYAMRSLCLRLWEVCAERAIAALVEPFPESIGREDTAGWKLDRYRVGLRFREHGREEILDQAGAEAKLRELAAPPRRRWFPIPWPPGKK